MTAPYHAHKEPTHDPYFTGTVVLLKPRHLSQERPRQLNWWRLFTVLMTILFAAYAIGGLIVGLGVLAIRAGAL